MGEKTALDLAGVLVTVGIFIPLVIERLYNFADSGNTRIMAMRFLFLSGWYLITYFVIYITKINTRLLRAAVLSNILLIGVFAVTTSLLVDAQKWSNTAQMLFGVLWWVSYSHGVAAVTILFPVAVFLIPIITLIKNKLVKKS